MKRIYVFFVVILLVCVFSGNRSVYAMETTGFVTKELSMDEIEEYLNYVNISKFSMEPEKRPIECFDVNENGMIAIGTEDKIDKKVCIYSDDGNFQYGFRFKTYGSFGVEWDNELLNIYFVRSDVSVSINQAGEIKNIEKICDTWENNSYWNYFVEARSRNVGEYQYVLKNDIGILGILTTDYSQLYKIDSFDNELLIYDVNSYQLFHILTIFIGVVVLVCFAVIRIAKEIKKLQRENINKYDV